MFSLVKELGIQASLKRELLPFSASFVIAEVLYKFHSFTLECIAFLATWYALSLVQDLVLGHKKYNP